MLSTDYTSNSSRINTACYLFWLLVLTQWSDWTECRAIDSRSCSGPGIRRKTRACENGCDKISNRNLTMTEDCAVTKDGF